MSLGYGCMVAIFVSSRTRLALDFLGLVPRVILNKSPCLLLGLKIDKMLYLHSCEFPVILCQ